MKKLILVLILIILLVMPIVAQTRPDSSIATTEDIVKFNPQMIKLLSVLSVFFIVSLTVFL